MKRSALERKSELRRGDDKELKRTELKRTSQLERTGRLRPRSRKTERTYVDRRKLVAQILEERPWCELRLPGICWRRSTTVHEVKTRGRGGSILNKANCKSSCAPCNDHVGDPRFKELVEEDGLLKHSWEEET